MESTIQVQRFHSLNPQKRGTVKKCVSRMLVQGALLLWGGVSVAGVRYGERNLLDFAKRDAQGKLVVESKVGPAGKEVWSNGEPEKAFDGNVSTYFNPREAKWDTWVGYDLTEPCHLTRVRFHGANAAAGQMERLCLASVAGIQTEGQSFSDVPDIFTTKDVVPTDWGANRTWFDVAPRAESRIPKYVGFRFGQRYVNTATYAGNVAELAFYGMTDESFKAFDGDRGTVLSLETDDSIERNFGAVVQVAEVRVVYASETAVGDRIEVSNSDDFSAPVTVLTVSKAPAVGTVVTYALTGVRGKCVRYVSSSGGQVAEIEFLPVSQAQGVCFERKLSSNYDPYFSIKFTPAVGNAGTTKVWRGPGRGGPWTLVKTLDDGASICDDADKPQPAGVVCYYKFGNAYSFDGVENEMPQPLVIQAPLLDEHLERTSEDLTKFASGCSMIANCGQYCWSPKSSSSWSDVTNSLLQAFDGNMSTLANVKIPDNPPMALGVDFGEPCRFTKFRLYFYFNNSNSNRIEKLKFAGSNNSDWKGNYTDLTTEFHWLGYADWNEHECNTNESYRYCFAHSPDGFNWGCNAYEMQFFGYRLSASSGVSIGVENFRVASVDSQNVNLTWDAAIYGGKYTVERKVDDGDWSAVATALTGTSYSDALPMRNNAAYRIVTENGNGPAYSETVYVTMYPRGNGTGLYTQVSSPFVSTTVNPDTQVTVLPPSNVGGVDLSAYANGVFAKWSGRLIAPIAGMYFFDTDNDKNACVWVDGRPVCFLCRESGDVTQKPVELAVGEHDVVVTVYRNGAGARAKLYWSGPIVREEIPMTQLLPIAPASLPEGWTEMRSFAPSADTYYQADYTVGSDGVIRAAFGGPDLWKAANGYAYLYQPLTGNFTLRVRVDRISGISYPCKAGVMLRSSLDADAPFEGYLLQMQKGNNQAIKLAGKTRTVKGARISDVAPGDAGGTQIAYSNGGAYLKVKKVDSTVWVYVRESKADPWTLAFERTLGSAFGKQVYVGLSVSGLLYEGLTVSETDEYFTPDYCAAFSSISVREVEGAMIIIR